MAIRGGQKIVHGKKRLKEFKAHLKNVNYVERKLKN